MHARACSILAVVLCLLAALLAREGTAQVIKTPTPYFCTGCTTPPPTVTFSNSAIPTTIDPAATWTTTMTICGSMDSSRVMFNGANVSSSFPIVTQTGVTGCNPKYTATGTVTLAFGTNTIDMHACSPTLSGNPGTCADYGGSFAHNWVQVSPHTATARGVVNEATSYTFQVQNLQSSAATYNLTITCSGSGVSGCSGPSSVPVGASGTAPVVVNYTGGALNTSGTIQLKAVASTNSAAKDSGIVTATSNWTNYLVVDVTHNDYDNQNYDLCAFQCFAASYAFRTIPTFSVGAARSVTVQYNGDRVAVRPTVQADVYLNAGHYPLQQYWLQAKIDGAFVTFTNGEQTLHFQPDTNETIRLAGQFDASGYATANYGFQIIVTAQYTDHTEQWVDSSQRLVIVNTRRSPVARGWTIGGVSQHYWESNGQQNWIMTAESDGSAELYGYLECFSWGCNWPSPAGLNDHFTYQNVWNWSEVDYPDSGKEVYNPGGYIIRRIGRTQDTVQYGYDAQNRVISISDPFRMYAGAHTYTKVAYNTTYGLASITEPGTDGTPGGGRPTTFVVNADSTLASITDPDLSTTRFLYDGARRLSAIINRRGDTTRLGYAADSSWSLAQVSHLHVPIDIGNGNTKDSSVTANYRSWRTIGVPLAATASTPATAMAANDSVHGQVTDPNGHLSQFTVNRFGAPVVATNPMGRTTTAYYPKLGAAPLRYYGLSPSPDSALSATGALDRFTYDGNGNLATIQEAGAATVYMHYGSYNQLDSVWGSAIPSARLFVGSLGRVDSIRTAGTDSNLSRFTYDSLTRLRSTTDPLGHSTSTLYDGTNGNVGTTFAANGLASVNYYDGYGRDTLVAVGGFSMKHVHYDRINRDSAEYDGVNANPTRYGYDPMYLTRIQDPAGLVYRDSINAMGFPTKVYDASDTILAVTLVRYDAVGNATSATNRRGQRMDFTYDPAGRVLTRGGTNAVSSTIAYDDTHYITAASNAVEIDSTFAESNGVMDSIVKHVSTSSGWRRYRIYYHSDGLQRTDSMNVSTDSASGHARLQFAARAYRYDLSSGVLDTMRLNGVTRYATTYSHNHDDLITGATYPGGITWSDSLTSTHVTYREDFHNNTAIDNAMNYKFGFDLLDRMTNVVVTRSPYTTWTNAQYRYDLLGRLMAVAQQTIQPANFATTCPSDTTSGFVCTTAAHTDTLIYDGSGNLAGGTVDGQSVASTYQAGNRAISLRGVAHTFDADGDVASSGLHNFHWSAEGRLDSVTTSTGTTLHYEYNAGGQLIRRSRNGALERIFIWDGDLLLAELDATGTQRIGEYVYDPITNKPYAFIDGTSTVGTVSYFDMDQGQNVIGLVRSDSGGTQSVRQQYAYDEFGAQTIIVDSLPANRLAWKGYIWEGDSTQLYYARSRWYDPQQGRFMSQDAAGMGGGHNLYAFAGSDYINGVDPTGRIYICFLTSYDPAVTVSPGGMDPIYYPGTATYTCFDDGLPDDPNDNGFPGEPGGGGGGGVPGYIGPPIPPPTYKYTCPPLPPGLVVPPVGADIATNMSTVSGLQNWGSFFDKSPVKAILGAGFKDRIFWDLLSEDKPWDFKNSENSDAYQAYGDFHFGAVGTAAGYSPVALYLAAGIANGKSPDSIPGYPYFGDDKIGHDWIVAGIEYAKSCKWTPIQ